MSLHLFYHTVETAGIACAMLLIVGILRQAREHFSAKIFVLMMLSTICFLIRTRQEYGYWIPEPLKFSEGLLLIPMDVFMNAFSGLFMIYAFSLFKETARFPRWLLLVFIFQLALEPVSLIYTRQELQAIDTLLNFPLSGFVFYQLPRILQIVFSGFALYWIISDWRADLVENRRILRWIFCAFIGASGIMSSLLYSFLIPQNQYIGYQTHVALVTAYACMLFMLVLVNFKLNLSFVTTLEPVNEAQSDDEDCDPEWDHDWQRFIHIFEKEQVYREPGLSIGSLAQKLAIPEYRLRKLIHQKLKYRNFNALLHEYRLRDALSDPAQTNVPILTIALTMGYQSINPFNRAFRELHGITPSAYRKKVVSQTNE